jgi:LacI family transcriptional regulator
LLYTTPYQALFSPKQADLKMASISDAWPRNLSPMDKTEEDRIVKRKRKVILLISHAREYDRGILRGIIEYAHIHGPWIFYEEAPLYLGDRNKEERLQHMLKWRADGMIAHESRAEESQKLKLPTVLLSNTHGLSSTQYQLRTDETAIGQLAARHLLRLGFRNLAYCGLYGMAWAEQRGSAFLQVMQKAKVATHVYQPRTLRPEESWYLEEEHLGNWLAALPTPIGLFACNDDRARMVAEICRLRGIRVPDEVSILGVDNDEHVCNLAHPPISSISLATERAGYETAALLARVMAKQPVNESIILTRPVQVVSRPSTDLIAVDDPNLVKAIRFIREQSNRIIQVRDVVSVAGVSRRVLQDRFKEVFGKTILDEIHDTRIQYISRMLCDTDLNMAAIASALGYETDAHLSRFFSRNTGMTPTHYRRAHRSS